MMRRTEQTSFAITFGSVSLPTLFFAKGQWFFAVACTLALVAAYFLSPNFRRYRQKVKGFAYFVSGINALGFLVGLAIYFEPSWDVGMVLLWVLVWAIAGFPIVKQIKQVRIH